MIFPLPLSPFEESLWLDDCPAFPWNIVVRLRFSGRLGREALRSAVAAAIARHPLLAANVGRDAAGRPAWVPARQPGPEIAWSPLADDGRLPAIPRIDACRDFPARFWAAEGGDRSELVAHLCHACVDGLGAIQFLGDLLLAYTAAVCGPSAAPPMPPVDENLLPRRGKYGLTAERLLRLSPKLAIGLLGARKFAMRKAMPLLPHAPIPADSPLPEGYPATLVHTFSVAETAAMLAAARRQQVTLNDHLACGWFTAMNGWQRSRGLSDDDRWLRLMVPMSLRGADDREMPAANIMSTVFLDRRPAHVDDPGRLLRGIHEEMALIKRNNLGLIFVLGLGVCRRMPGGIERMVHRQPSLATAILTNLNRPLEPLPLPREDAKIVAGNVVLQGCELFPAIRPGTCAAVGLLSYAGRLGLCLHYDARVLDLAQATDLLGRFVAAAGSEGD
jgi:hypothetical protein